MDVRTLQEEMRKLSSIVDDWDSSERASGIERDLVLEKLRALYEAVRFFEAPSPEPVEAETPAEIDLGIDFSFGALSLNAPSEPEVTQQSELDNEPEPEVEPESGSGGESEPEPLSVVEPEEQGGADEDVPAEKLPEPETKPVAAPMLFVMDTDEDMLRHRQKQRVIMSLYHDEPARSEIGALAASLTASASEQPEQSVVELVSEIEPMPEPIAAPEHAATAGYAAEPAEEDPFGEENPFEEISIPKSVGDTAPGAVLGDVINHDVQTLADTIAPQRDVASDLRRSESVGDLRRAIGLNDRFLLVRDLFEGDADACDAALEELNNCESLDDCMIYIAENYVWNPNSDGAKFLMELIERKFE